MADKILIADLEINYEDVLKSLVELKKGIDDTKASTAELMAQQKALDENGQKGTQQYERNAKAIETNNIVLQGLTSEYKNNQKVLTTNIAAQKDGQGTLERLEARNKELRIALKGLNLETEEGKKKQREYITEINRNTEEMRKNSDAAVQQKMNIGNYKSALDSLPPSLQNSVRGFQSMTAAAKIFLANPIVLAIAAIVGVVTTLVTAFKRTEEGGDRVKRMFDQVKASVEVISDRIENFATGLFKVFSGEGKLRDLKGTFKGIGDEIQRDVEQAGKLFDMMDQLEEREIDMITISADRTAQIAKLREQASDQNKTESERIKLLAQSIVLMEEEATAQQKLVLTKIANELGMTDEAEVLERINQIRKEGKQLTLDELGLSNSTNEDRKRANELVAQYINLEEQFATEKRRVVSTISGLVKKQTEKEEKLSKMAASKEDPLEKIVTAKMDELNAVLAIKKMEMEGIRDIQLNVELEIAQLVYDTRIASGQNLFEAERQLLQAEMQAELNAAQQTGAQRYMIEQKYAAYNKALAREEQAAKLAIYSDFAGSLASLFGNNTKIGRIASVAQATINTYLGATAAFAQTPGGIVIKSAAAASAIIQGLASVKKILSTKSGLPGDSGGGSGAVSAPSVSAGVTNVASAPNPNMAGYFGKEQQNTQTVLVLEDFQLVQDNANRVKIQSEL